MVHEGPASSDAKGSRWGRVELLVLVGSRSSGHLNTVHRRYRSQWSAVVCSGLQWSAVVCSGLQCTMCSMMFYDVL